jgi:hypothetical protein
MTDEIPIRKPRSLQTRDPLWGVGGPDKKHFKLSGAAPTNAPSNGVVKHKDRNICKKAPDHQHHYEVVVDRFYKWSEHMVDQCVHCGKKKGWGFTVYIVKPEWIKKLEAQRRSKAGTAWWD